MHKLLTKILTNRLTTKVESYQTKEKGGFTKCFGTLDYLLKKKIPIEKANEYQIPLHTALVDFEKAVNNVVKVKNSEQNSKIDYTRGYLY